MKKGPSKDDKFRAIVKAQMSLHGYRSQRQLGLRVGADQTSVSRKMQHPDRMTLGELRKWAEVLDMTPAELAQFI